MPIIYLLRFNNYYNRIVKKFDTLNQYLVSPYYDNSYIENNLNFNPNDGVDTQYIMNNPKGWVPSDYDYLIYSEDGLNITSRWFITEAKRTRQGQYQLTLRRDLVVDNYDVITQAPCFIEKATLNESDPMIYNSEDMTFNQIKKAEYLLKDETKCPWLVGYIATKNAENVVQEYTCDAIFNTLDLSADVIVNGLNNWEYYQYIDNSNFIGPINNIYYDTSIIAFRAGGTTSLEKIWYRSDNTGNRYTRLINGVDTPFQVTKKTNEYYSTVSNNLEQTYAEAVKTNIETLKSTIYNNIPYHTTSQVEDLINLNGKILEDSSTNKYYTITITSDGQGEYIETVPSGSNIWNAYVAVTDKLKNDGKIVGTAKYTPYRYIYYANKYKVILTELKGYSAKVDIKSTRYHLEDAPYDMFCMPYSDDLKVYDGVNVKYTSNKEMSFQVMMELARKYGGGDAKFLYDIQLLPYCPVRDLIKQDGSFNVNGDNKAVSYILDNNGQIIGGIFFAKKSQFTLNIYNAEINNISKPISEILQITNKKIQSQCDMYRLCSPNYNGVFEFNAAKNEICNFINIDCTYKPYNVYIHANPDFNGLYGSDFNDSRGLIVGGDFSLPQTTSAWESYQLSNKNYLSTFNRQIENMEVNNKYQNIQSLVGGATSALTAGVTAGAVFGPIGGIVSGLASAAGAGADYAIQKALQNEALDYTKDQFGYQLGNIQALPSGLSKTSALTFNNKIYLFLEYYTCSDEEKQALQNKIKYNGMTVMRIGTIGEFIKSEPSYIKGKVIRLEGINEDTNYLNQIANEIYKGVYI